MKIAKIFRTADVLSESRSRDLQNIKRIGKNVIVVIYRYCFYSSPPLVDILPRCFKVFTLRSYFGFMNYTWLKNLQESALWCGSGIGCQLIWRKRYFLTGGTAEEGSSGKIIRNRHWHCCCGVFFFCRRIMRVVVYEVGSTSHLASVHKWNAPSSTLLQLSLRKDLGPFSYKVGAWGVTALNTIIHGQIFTWLWTVIGVTFD